MRVGDDGTAGSRPATAALGFQPRRDDPCGPVLVGNFKLEHTDNAVRPRLAKTARAPPSRRWAESARHRLSTNSRGTVSRFGPCAGIISKDGNYPETRAEYAFSRFDAASITSGSNSFRYFEINASADISIIPNSTSLRKPDDGFRVSAGSAMVLRTPTRSSFWRVRLSRLVFPASRLSAPSSARITMAKSDANGSSMFRPSTLQSCRSAARYTSSRPRRPALAIHLRNFSWSHSLSSLGTNTGAPL